MWGGLFCIFMARLLLWQWKTYFMVTKHFLNLVLLGVVSIGLMNCGGNKQDYALTKTPPFAISEAYYQEWLAGTPQGGSGYNVHILLGTLTDEVVIDSIYFRRMVVNAQRTSESEIRYVGNFKRSDRNIVMDSDPLKEVGNKLPQPFPFELEDNQAVVSYFHYGTQRYFKIKKLDEKEVLAYPGTGTQRDN